MTLRATQLAGFAARRLLLTTITLDQDRDSVDLFTEFNEPADLATYTVIIVSGVTIGSASAATPALTTSALFIPGSDFVIVFQGSAQVIGKGGPGGDGGKGVSDPEPIIRGQGGGGGGGQGSGISLGGAAGGPQAFAGQNGSVSNFGSGGLGSTTGLGPETNGQVGANGGVAIETFYDMIIDGQTEPGDGRIYGGGAGGSGSTPTVLPFGGGFRDGADGAPFGEDSTGFQPAFGGAAILVQAGTVIYLPNKAALDIRGAAPA